MNKEKQIYNLEQLLHLIKEGNTYGVGLKDVENKIKSAIEDLNNDLLNVVLFGSFSDGKTTVAAGWLEEEFENMKIDSNESSDEICIYNSSIKNVRIIDTPGLFGDKEKSTDKGVIKFEKETKDYISQAHLILYVVEAVNPIKDSHKDVIKWVLKDLGKLQQTIFVINKMDDVADLEDENDFKRNAEIKTKVVQDTLRSFLNLTEEDLKELHIVCVSANPFNEGLSDWLQNKDEYRELSHLEGLKITTNNIVENSQEKLKEEVSKSVLRDIIYKKTNELEEIISSEKQNVHKQKLQLKKLNSDLGFLKSDAVSAVEEAKQSLINLRATIFNEIDASSRDNYYSVIERNLGIKRDGKKIEVGYILQQRVQSIMDEVIVGLQGQTQKIVFELEETVSEINDDMQRLAASGLSGILKNASKVPVSTIRDTILSTRNMLKFSVKFKPYGAIKLANKFAKALLL